MASSDMKGFFRQQKKKSGISKPNLSKKSQKSKHPASHGSDVSHGSLDLQDEYDDKEEVLRQFDMNMAYGPCLGMTRLDRWKRANALGLNPPRELETMLRAGKVNSDCLWDGRV
ncbi:hypothetical protein ACJIZ3_022524 [Penstemon smallii]|uniref:DNA polymerase delta subunit 4 n=1 Tax=Penstemon smallii TaxID=265156 RepID=A0ABD3TPD9_9LAMI